MRVAHVVLAHIITASTVAFFVSLFYEERIAGLHDRASARIHALEERILHCR